jgi:hypothetical protein
VYHLELRQFPKRLQRFNFSGTGIGAVLLPWVQERVIELDEQKFSPHHATITVIEGPEIPIEQISMARGWRTVEREGKDVTQRVLAEAREALASGAAGEGGDAVAGGGVSGAPSAAAGRPAAGAGASGAAPDPLALGVEIASLLGEQPSRLLAAWRAVAARSSGLSPSESLALAERELAREDPSAP